MYQPAHFEQPDVAAMQALMRAHPLALLVTSGADGPVADAVPLRLDAARGAQGTLVGHVARANPLWRRSGPCLVVFQGPQAYVSPAWYPGKPVHGKVVPTWNYTMVQARGALRAIEDAAALRSIVAALTNEHEAGLPQPWRVDDAPPDYIEAMLRAIVGIEIPIEQLAGKWKTSQNRDAADRAGVAAGLRTRPGEPAQAMAALVEPQPPAPA